MTSTEQQQIDDTDRLTRAAIFAADTHVMRAIAAGATGAEITRVAIHAGIGVLIAQGLITITPQWPEWLLTDVPDHLAPTIRRAPTIRSHQITE